jgi:hypothetical protein
MENKTPERGVSRREGIRRGGTSFCPDEEYPAKEMNEEKGGFRSTRRQRQEGWQAKGDTLVDHDREGNSRAVAVYNRGIAC